MQKGVLQLQRKVTPANEPSGSRSAARERDYEEEVFCMTSGSKNNIFVVGAPKNPQKPLPTVSKSQVAKALASAERYKKK